MAGENTSTTLSALFKQVYGPTLQYLPPKGQQLIRLIDFVPGERMPGNYYNQPVVLKHEHGFTYAAAGSDAFAVSDQVAGYVGNAQVLGGQILLQSALGYEAAARASQGGRRAFVAATKYLVESMMQSMRKRLEIELMYGKTGLGAVSSFNSNVITVTTASWAPGIWAGMEGATIHVVASDVSASRGTATISKVDIGARTVTVGAGLSGVTAGDLIFFSGQVTAGGTPTWNVVSGLHDILTTSGTLFGIDSSSYSLWKGNTLSAGSSALSHAIIQKAMALVTGKGGEGDYVLICNPLAWANLAGAEAAYRRYVGAESQTKYATGTGALQYATQAGTVTIVPSIYCKEGFAYLINPDDFVRIGATDITFRLPDRGDEYFFHSATSAAYMLRCYSNQALFCEAPGRQCVITNIVNS